ncbi:phosphatase PAP2 family protein [Candidatus Uhrbacteria bacterium CG10_big_fil_rev_8_21_14_0_10_48_11]|uniref:Phosphatase PAP2 family protein n=1 Tax=Candidatus Uhrbacteria bacterium CG10_big_fil_rev_8_21_14_0_10_48_11 TaxID=1975037 RepID=A0A2M8LF30_9BACT|nr:MAG: phosphatase PAP2 family protein [Candidatus Uhrbacteria bacterium CG10_big_fil_rev_8_21_14_0_10_48_11]
MRKQNITRILLWLAGFIVASYGIYFVSQGPFAVLDVWVAHVVITLRSPLLNIILFIATLFGRELLIAFIAIAVATLYLRRHAADALLLAVGTGSAGLLQFVLKHIFARPRPLFSPLTIENTYSFPSGHSLSALVFYGLLALFVYWYTTNHQRRVWAAVIASLIILAIGFSRVYLGVHWLSDVIGGYLIGGWLLVLLASLRPYFVKRFGRIRP